MLEIDHCDQITDQAATKLVRLSKYLKSQGHIARDNLKIKFFKLNSWSPGAGFFPIAPINLLSVNMIRDSNL